MSIFFKKSRENFLFSFITVSLYVCSLQSECFASRRRLLRPSVLNQQPAPVVVEQQPTATNIGGQQFTTVVIEEDQIEAIVQKLGLITEQIQQLNSKFDNFTLEINSRLDKIDTRIDDSTAAIDDLGYVLFGPEA